MSASYANADEAFLRIVLSDTGPGIAPELQTRLFEPFATGRPDGTGLGLAIAREMVRGAWRQARARPDRGRRCRGHLHHRKSRRAKMPKILIVDDDAALRGSIAETLSDWRSPSGHRAGR